MILIMLAAAGFGILSAVLQQLLSGTMFAGVDAAYYGSFALGNVSGLVLWLLVCRRKL